MRDPDKLGQVGKAWRVAPRADGIVDMWFINLPAFHPMTQWFAVCEWVDPDAHTVEVFLYIVDPESYLWQEPDPDTFREQGIKFFPEAVLNHFLSKATIATHPVLLAAFVQAIVEGQIQPNEDNVPNMGNFLTNTARWLSP